MEQHYKQKKEKLTVEILKRALIKLSKISAPIILNQKRYKKINYSYGQILNAMYSIATEDEISNNLIPNDISTISKNTSYKSLIDNAKIGNKKILDNSEKNSFNEYDKLDLIVNLQTSIEREKLLLRENNELKALLKQFEEKNIQKYDKTQIMKEETLVYDLAQINNFVCGQTEILKKLLVGLSENFQLKITKDKHKKSSFIEIEFGSGYEYLCSLSEILDLNLNIKNGKIFFKDLLNE